MYQGLMKINRGPRESNLGFSLPLRSWMSKITCLFPFPALTSDDNQKGFQDIRMLFSLVHRKEGTMLSLMLLCTMYTSLISIQSYIVQ